MTDTNKPAAAAAAKRKVIIERTYRAQVEELWELWTTKKGFESWWGPQGFRVEVRALEPRAGGALHYDMIAETPEMIEAMKRMARPASTETRGRFVQVKAHERLAITHVIDFLPGVAPYESTLLVEFFPSGESVRMVVTLDPMHDEEFTKMSTMGFTSQLKKLDKRFGDQSALPAVAAFLMFEGKAEEAMTWYVSLIKNSAVVRVERYGPQGPGKEGSVVHATFTLNGREFMCIDSPVKHQFTFTPAISLFVDCETRSEVDRLFAALSDGGKVMMALDAYPFSKRFGWLADKYGVSWQLRLAEGAS